MIDEAQPKASDLEVKVDNLQNYFSDAIQYYTVQRKEATHAKGFELAFPKSCPKSIHARFITNFFGFVGLGALAIGAIETYEAAISTNLLTLNELKILDLFSEKLHTIHQLYSQWEAIDVLPGMNKPPLEVGQQQINDMRELAKAISVSDVSETLENYAKRIGPLDISTSDVVDQIIPAKEYISSTEDIAREKFGHQVRAFVFGVPSSIVVAAAFYRGHKARSKRKDLRARIPTTKSLKRIGDWTAEQVQVKTYEHHPLAQEILDLSILHGEIGGNSERFSRFNTIRTNHDTLLHATKDATEDQLYALQHIINKTRVQLGNQNETVLNEPLNLALETATYDFYKENKKDLK